MSGPISPDQISEWKGKSIPSEIFEIFNILIARNFTNGSSMVKQKAVIDEIFIKFPDIERGKIFNEGWLNIEESYRDKGWIVFYDGPAYNESYDAFWTFKPKKSGII